MPSMCIRQEVNIYFKNIAAFKCNIIICSALKMPVAISIEVLEQKNKLINVL